MVLDDPYAFAKSSIRRTRIFLTASHSGGAQGNLAHRFPSRIDIWFEFVLAGVMAPLVFMWQRLILFAAPSLIAPLAILVSACTGTCRPWASHATVPAGLSCRASLRGAAAALWAIVLAVALYFDCPPISSGKPHESLASGAPAGEPHGAFAPRCPGGCGLYETEQVAGKSPDCKAYLTREMARIEKLSPNVEVVYRLFSRAGLASHKRSRRRSCSVALPQQPFNTPGSGRTSQRRSRPSCRGILFSDILFVGLNPLTKREMSHVARDCCRIDRSSCCSSDRAALLEDSRWKR